MAFLHPLPFFGEAGEGGVFSLLGERREEWRRGKDGISFYILHGTVLQKGLMTILSTHTHLRGVCV